MASVVMKTLVNTAFLSRGGFCVSAQFLGASGGGVSHSMRVPHTVSEGTLWTCRAVDARAASRRIRTSAKRAPTALGNLANIQDLYGHTDPTTTRIYPAPTLAKQRDVIRRLRVVTDQ